MSTAISTSLSHPSEFDRFVTDATAVVSQSTEIPVQLNTSYEFLPRAVWTERQRKDYASLSSEGDTKAVLAPRVGGSRATLPVGLDSLEVWERISRGCSWAEAASILSEEIVVNLFLQGLLSTIIDGKELSGPIIPLFVKVTTGTWTYSEPKTDELSYRALFHAGRMPNQDFASLVTRLYTYNHHGVFDSQEIVTAEEQATQFTSRDSVAGYRRAPDSPNNNHWTYFLSDRASLARDQSDVDYKIYISPRVRDLGRALSELESILPRSSAHSWKIGRGHYGITRPDKICLYFNNRELATEAGRLLAENLYGIESQGVPFTHRFSADGLVSGGMDPPIPRTSGKATQPLSWRLLVARKLAAALIVAKQTKHYPISPVEAALQSLELLGVRTQSWEVVTDQLWRI